MISFLKKRKFVCLLAAAALLSVSGWGSIASASSGVTVTVNGQTCPLKEVLVLEKGTTLISSQGLSTILGSEMGLTQENEAITIKRNDLGIILKPGQTAAQVNGKQAELLVAPRLEQDGLLLPLRAVCEALNAAVSWNGATRTIDITVPPGKQAVADSAQKLIQNLISKNYPAVVASFSPEIVAALPADKLQETWEQLQAQVGSLQSITGVRTENNQQHVIVYVGCQFEKQSLDLRLSFNPLQQVDGINFIPTQVTYDYQAPDYVNQASFTETEVTVGSGPWALPGTLSVPAGEGPFPAVVLVQGSGPSDRDETIGPNKPFRDLAWGLASHGVAVLRYEKRTKEYPNEVTAILNQFTTKQETTDDALAAVSLLRQTKNIDSKHIFVLGHSLGGMLAPRIGQSDPGIAGLIVLAGPTRPLVDLMVEQYSYLLSLGQIDQAQLEAIKQQAAQVNALTAATANSSRESLLLGAPDAYWLDLKGYNPAVLAAGLPQPMLILQGGRDYQVTAQDDYPGWQKELQSKTNATFKLYPDLNHLFITGEGKSKPSEYEQAGHVSGSVVSDIAAWINKQ
jgi:dienelactone hydrolase